METPCLLSPILRPLPEALLGPRVRLSPPCPGDGAATWDAIEEGRAELRLWLPWVDQMHSVAAIPRRLNFVHEATLRNEARDPQGCLHDTMVFAMTPADYARTRG
jgi:hypothetical protein